VRKLKLQMQISIDGFVAGPEGQLDWMTMSKDEPLISHINRIADSSDTILLGRKMTPGFIHYWESVGRESAEHDFAQKMVETPKIAFSATLHHLDGRNLRVENGELTEEVRSLKAKSGKDLLVYGGAAFVSSLLDRGLIDELNLFVNPIALGEGMRIFNKRASWVLQDTNRYDCGVVVHTYRKA
jgi:dihydrofolate reductase